MRREQNARSIDSADVAGNGLMDRRLFLSGAAAGIAYSAPAAAGELAIEPWMQTPGAPFVAYGQPSRFEDKVVRVGAAPPNAPGTGATRTPLHLLNGIITPNSLHFERSHSGVPDIDPSVHRLLIHGLVERPLTFSLEAFSRYPMESRIAFIECGGDSAALNQKDPAPLNAQALHGLLSRAEWTAVRLSTLLDEAGLDPAAKWILAEGADAASMSRSVPIEKALDDALVALYQNGERLRPSNGYPMRLLLPGFEGNMQEKIALGLETKIDSHRQARQLHELRSRLHRSGAKDFAAPRQPVRPEVGTHVVGTDCHLCPRSRHKDCGGGGGIRTRDTVSRIHTFQACAFNHSATPPHGLFALRPSASERAI